MGHDEELEGRRGPLCQADYEGYKRPKRVSNGKKGAIRETVEEVRK